MKLYKAKEIALLFNESKKLKRMPEEDCEGMTSASVLSPSAEVTGGDITNSDSYAPGDNRIPKSLFNQPQRRKRAEEDSEELLKGNFLFRAMDEREFYKILETKTLYFKELADDIRNVNLMFNANKSHGFNFKDKELTLNYLNKILEAGYKYYLSFFRSKSWYSNMERPKGEYSLIVFFDKDALKSLPNSKLIPFSAHGQRSLEKHTDAEAEDRLISKNKEVQIDINRFIKGVYFSTQFYEADKLKNICKNYKIKVFGDYKERGKEWGEKKPTLLSNFKALDSGEEDEEILDIPDDFFSDKELAKIEQEVDKTGQSYYEVKRRHFIKNGGLDEDRPLTLDELKKGFAKIEQELDKIDKPQYQVKHHHFIKNEGLDKDKPLTLDELKKGFAKIKDLLDK